MKIGFARRLAVAVALLLGAGGVARAEGTTFFYSGLEAGETAPTWNDTVDSSQNVGGYCCGQTVMESSARGEKGFNGTMSALVYSGTDNSASASFSYNRVFDVNIPITSDTQLQYFVFPQNIASNTNSAFVAIDLIFTDGSSLRDSGATDQTGTRVHPKFQGSRLALESWNEVRSNIGTWKAGKTIDKILVAYDQPSSTGQFRGYVDAIRIGRSTPDAANTDALQARVRSELKGFTDWLKTNNVKGYIGEVGWPDDGRKDGTHWNALADLWYQDADAANLWVTNWATGEWWGSTYNLGSYEDASSTIAGVDTANSQAKVIEAHRTNSNYLRGVNDAGGEFGANGDGSFSNNNPGAYDQQYHYDGSATFAYLYGRGVRLIRLPFRWERIQRALGGALDAAETQRLKDAVARARGAGLQVVLDLHNYGEYYLYDGTRGVRRTVGSSFVTNAHFSDLWRRLSVEFKTDSGVFYGLMNEPHDIPDAGGKSGAKIWEEASQAALNAIRGNGDTKTVLVPGYNWSSVPSWKSTHPAPWIADSANNFRYEAHHYWDRDNSGDYPDRYADEVSDAASRGFAASGPRLYGTLQNTSARAVSNFNAGMRVAIIELSWSSYNTADGVYNATYRDSIKARIAAFRSAGFTQFQLGFGLQYPPSWVQSLPNARFVNQFARAYVDTAPGKNVVNGVFNNTVRTKMANYMARVFSDLGRDWQSVRLGGSWYGELHYPAATFGADANSWWGYDAIAQGSASGLPAGVAVCPVPGWKPGQSSPANQASQFANWYMDSLKNFHDWQISTVRQNFGGALVMLYPGFGIRGGELSAAIAANLAAGGSKILSTGEAQAGADFSRFINGLNDAGVIVYSTHIDTPDSWSTESSTDPNKWCPMRWMGSLADAHRLKLRKWGENTGAGFNADMDRTFLRIGAKPSGADAMGVMWAFEPELFNGTHASLSYYQSKIAALP